MADEDQSGDLSDAIFITDAERDPVTLARREQKRPKPKRFYREAGLAETPGGFQLTLDGRPARTPARAPLAVPDRPLAEVLAAEWSGQGEEIDMPSMPLTRIVQTALDGVAREMEGVRADIARYAGSDLLCYRAGDPQSLVAAQAAAWDPVLDWAHEAHGARFILSEGIIHVAQPEPALAALTARLAAIDSPLRLAAIHIMTTLMGSVLLALAVAEGRLSAAEAWAAAHVDEDHQMRLWGADAEAMERRALRWRDMEAAALAARSAS